MNATAPHDSSASGKFVDHKTFAKLLMSSRRLIRCDSFGGGVRGVEDRDTGERFLIEQRDLEKIETHHG